jgi:hypothetical protein
MAVHERAIPMANRHRCQSENEPDGYRFEPIVPMIRAARFHRLSVASVLLYPNPRGGSREKSIFSVIDIIFLLG